MTPEQAPHVDAADEALDLWVRAAAARDELVAATRRRRVRALVALVLVFGVGLLAGRAAAATPRPDPAPPLRYTKKQIARAAFTWSAFVLSTPDADGVEWVPTRARCTSRRRCSVLGWWWIGDEGAPATYHFRQCKATRRVWEHDLARTRRGAWIARILVDRRGGVVCRLIDPPYIPYRGAA